jgi:hypothetical protein
MFTHSHERGKNMKASKVVPTSEEVGKGFEGVSIVETDGTCTSGGDRACDK